MSFAVNYSQISGSADASHACFNDSLKQMWFSFVTLGGRHMSSVLLSMMIKSVIVALIAAGIALALGSGLLIALGLYSMVGSSTLLGLAAWHVRRNYF